MAGMNTRRLGTFGEEKAVTYLLKNNYTILQTNYRVGRLGEIDIIARDSEYICFIEVKTRRSNTFGTPGESVTKAKQTKIQRIASIYLSNMRSTNEYIRFDVIEVIIWPYLDCTDVVRNINHIKNAF